MFHLPLEMYPTETNKGVDIFSLMLITLAQIALLSPRFERSYSPTFPLGYVKTATSLSCLIPNSQPKKPWTHSLAVYPISVNTHHVRTLVFPETYTFLRSSHSPPFVIPSPGPVTPLNTPDIYWTPSIAWLPPLLYCLLSSLMGPPVASQQFCTHLL